MSLLKKLKEKTELKRKQNTYEYWLERAKSKTTSYLYSVPVKFRDKKMCLACITNDDYNVKFVNREFFDDLDFCMELTKSDLRYYIQMNKIPNFFKLLSKELYSVALLNNWEYISFMNLDIFDNNLWKIALKSSEGKAFEYYPEEKKQKLKYEDYFKLVKYPYALRYVPLNYRDKAMCLEALKHVNSKDSTLIYTYVFDSIPKVYRDEEMYLAMVKACPSYLEKVPDEYYENVRIAYNKHLEESSEQSNENVISENNK